ncbi:ectoine/hydroxyectoine ABC transporter permease subunit EhuC [Streptomyces sp. 8L]|uniref:ectoine/hydroxyectoine ABC transporter permease subunit EhuC n=1 Tax=Streptomyces sp. 8L TaxID=2877242 RepID=UPI001CD7F6AD|nr:ectoine/hydroxyectoine ABC transporter permease subunit EhuC [Streptomyces sp. 8L]MCA1219823.1 ectoine/hydroxyectoine ABC transporter permease subunit EhuC [Streptomyces sp. 8L]
MNTFFTAFFDDLPQVLSGLGVTAEATVLGALFAFVLSFVLGLMAGHRNIIVRGVSRTIVEFFRGTSLYVQLFWLYFALPLLSGYQLSGLFCGVLAFALNFGAYGSEVVRGGISAVPRAQWEAAVALNLSPYQRMRRVIMPQALAQMIPSFTNLLIQLLKATPLLWLIGTADLMTVIQQLRDRTGESLVSYLTLLVFYFIIAYVLTLLMNLLEKAAKARLGQHTGARGLFSSRSAAAVESVPVVGGGA